MRSFEWRGLRVERGRLLLLRRGQLAGVRPWWHASCLCLLLRKGRVLLHVGEVGLLRQTIRVAIRGGVGVLWLTWQTIVGGRPWDRGADAGKAGHAHGHVREGEAIRVRLDDGAGWE